MVFLLDIVDVILTLLYSFSLYNLKESMEDSHKRSGKGGSDSERPLHGLLQLKEQMGTKELTLSLNYERGEAGGEGIDLNLKL